MANRFWVGGTGTWNGSNTANWSATSGGTGGASVPTGGDVVIFDANSNNGNSGASYTVTLAGINASATSVTFNNPSAGTLNFTGTGNIATSTLTVGETVNATGWVGNLNVSGSTSLNTNGSVIGANINISSTLTLTGNSVTTGSVSLTNGGFASKLIMGGFTLTCSTFVSQANGTITPAFDFSAGGTVNITSTSTGTVVSNLYGSSTISGTMAFNLVGNAPNGVTRTVSLSSWSGVSLKVSAGSDMVAIGSSSYSNLDFTGFTGTVSGGSPSSSGSAIFPSTISGLILTGITINGSTASTVTFPGFSIATNVTFNNNTGGSWTVSGLSTSGTITQTAGTVTFASEITTTNNSGYTFGGSSTTSILNLNGFNLNTPIFTSTATGTRSIQFGSNAINLTTTATSTALNMVGTNFSFTGIPNFNLVGDAASGIIRTVTLGNTFTAANSVNVNVAAGQSGNIIRPTSPFNVRNLDFTNASSSTLDLNTSTVNMTVYGSLILPTTVSGNTTQLTTFAATTTGNVIKSNGNTLWRIVFNGAGGEWTLQDTLTQNGSMNTTAVTLTAGTLRLNNQILSVRTFSSSNSNTRTIDFGSSGQIILNTDQGVTLWDTSTVTGLTVLGTPYVRIVCGSLNESLTISAGAVTSNPFSFYLPMNTPGFSLSGTGTLTITGNVGTLDFTSLPATLRLLANTNINIYGDLILNSNVALTNAGITLNFPSSTNNIINPNGSTMTGTNLAWNFNGTGSWTLASALSSTTATITQTAGSINTSGFSVSGSSYTNSSLVPSSLSLGSSVLTLSGAIPWNVSSANMTFSSGTSNIICTNAAPTFNGNGLAYYDLTFSNSLVSSIRLNGANSFNNVSFATPTSFKYVPVFFGENQTLAGALAITGTTAANFRMLFRSSTLGTQRTITANSISNLSDIDFQDIKALGSSIPWTGTRLGDGQNNLNITFATPKTVTALGAFGSSVNNWSQQTSWTVSGVTSVNNFPLPQDTVSASNNSSGIGITFDYPYILGNLSIGAFNGAISFGSSVITGNINLQQSFSSAGTGTPTFYNRSGAAQTVNITTSSTMSMTINTNGTVALAAALSVGSISHVNGTLNTQNFSLTATSYSSLFSGNVRTLTLGSSTFTLTYGSDSSSGFVVNTDGWTFNKGTSTVVMSGSTFGIRSDGNLSFYNLSITSATMSGSVIGTFTENESGFDLSTNNFSVSGRASPSHGVLVFSGINNFSSTGTLSFPTFPGDSRYRTLFFSQDRIMNVSANNVSAFGVSDFSGFNVTSASWSGTSVGNAGRNSGINFTAPKTVYWVGGTGAWNSSNWATVSAGAGALANYPLPQDTMIFDANSGGSTILQPIANFVGGTYDFSGRGSTATTLSSINGDIYSTGNVILATGVTVSGTNTWTFLGDGTQNINTAGKTLTQNVNINCAGTVNLQSNVTSSAPSSGTGLRIYSGTINLNSFTWSTPVMNITNLYQNKTLAFGTGNIALTSFNTTVLNITTAGGTNLSVNGTPVINVTTTTNNNTRIINTPGLNSQAKAISVNFTAGSDIITLNSGSGILNFSTQGHSGTVIHTGPINLYGSYAFGTGGGTASGDISINYVGSGSNTLTTNGKTMYGQLVINSPGGTLVQQDNLTLTQFSGSPISYLKLQQGTYDANGKNITVDRFVGTGSNVRTLNMGAGTWALTAIDDALSNTAIWDIGTGAPPVGLTVNPSTSTISVNGNGTKSFNGGSQIYNNLAIAGTGQLSVKGFNRFNTISNSTTNLSLLFAGSTPQAFTNFNINGTAGNLVTVGSTNTSQATLYKSSSWNIGTGSVDGGGNTGLSFTSGTNNFLNVSNINATNVDPGSPSAFYTNAAVSWVGLQALAKLATDISTSWVGMQVLSSTFGNNPTPNYLDFGTISDPMPGTTYTSSAVAVNGLTANLVIDIFSNDGLLFSTDGNTFTSTAQIQNGDQLTLRVNLQSITPRYLKVLTTPPNSADTDIGHWYVSGPSSASKYDQYLYRELGNVPWIDIQQTFVESGTMISSAQSVGEQSSFSKLSMLFKSPSIGTTAAPLGEWKSQLALSTMLAPTGLFGTSYARSSTAAPDGNFANNLSFNNTNTMTYYVLEYVYDKTTDSNLTKFSLQENNPAIYWDVLKSRSTVWSFDGHYVIMPIATPAAISEKVHNILVDKIYQMTTVEKQNKYDPVQEVWRTWEEYIATPTWNIIHEATAFNAETGWNYQHYLDSLSESATAWEQLKSQTSTVMAPTAILDSHGVLLSQIILADYISSPNSPFSSVMIGEYGNNVTNLPVSMNPAFEWERIYESTNYVRQGGYETPELAADAAQVYSMYPTTVYTQPEGTYSFLVEHDMALWCSTAPRGLRVVAWLMGGG